MKEGSVSRKTVIVTGASRGIGAATALLAAEAGYDLFMVYNRGCDAVETIAVEARRSGATVTVCQTDIASDIGIAELFRVFDASFDTLYGLVNNAGITGPMTTLSGLARPDLERVFAINVFASFMIAKGAMERMAPSAARDGAAIVNVSSRAAQLGGANEWLHYAATKGAIDTFTVGLAREAAPAGIRVNAVSPGLIETEIHAASGDPGRLARLAHTVPMGRSGTAAEVAETILWLLSGTAPYVSGANVVISGAR
ncbi:MAG: SDR family oxidoreductase [Hyphomicrobiales bacterium]|nr:SDR family oxidoreductase [Hyphomicrobiales bacterium]